MPADEVWRRYFAQVRAAAASGLFDVLAHLDLAKVFGHSASQSVIESEHEQTADAIAAAGIAVEISTAGLRKAAGELYPAQDLLRALHRRGVPITLGSDAHVPGGSRARLRPRARGRARLRLPHGLDVQRPRAARGTAWLSCASARPSTRTGSSRACRSCSAASRSRTPTASRGTPTPTSSATRSATRCSAPPASTTSARCSRRATSAGAARAASICSPRPGAASRPWAGASSTSTRSWCCRSRRSRPTATPCARTSPTPCGATSGACRCAPPAPTASASRAAARARPARPSRCCTLG